MPEILMKHVHLCLITLMTGFRSMALFNPWQTLPGEKCIGAGLRERPNKFPNEFVLSLVIVVNDKFLFSFNRFLQSLCSLVSCNLYKRATSLSKINLSPDILDYIRDLVDQGYLDPIGEKIFELEQADKAFRSV